MLFRVFLLAGGAMLSLPAVAQTAPQGDDAAAPVVGLDEIIVTAQRRSENVNTVPMSITAASSEALVNRGVTQMAELGKVSPGLTFSPTAYATPVFTLRGIGFNENTLAASPNVAVYVDEVPLPYPVMSGGALLDPERVEVLKGPQGLLYGQNSTGGAINFVAAKPTTDFSAGFTTSYSRFGLWEAQGFVSGPITDTLGARVAVQTAQGGAWQKSYTRDDELGSQDLLQGRLLLEWQPSDGMNFTLYVNGWRDKSDNQAPQMFETRAARPATAVPGVINTPPAPENARAADWTPDTDFDRDNKYRQVALRADIDLSDAVSLTSLTSFAKYDHDIATDADGTQHRNFDAFITGDIETAYQEVRLTGDHGRLRWIAGVNYADDTVREDQLYDFREGSTRFIGGPVNVELMANYSVQKMKTYAGFGQVSYDVTPELTLEGGARYTRAERDFAGCTSDAGNGLLSAGFVGLQRFYVPGRDPIAVPAGGCGTMNAAFEPEEVRDALNEDNVSWRVGLTWEPMDRQMFYANVSRGYKAGSFPTLNAFFAQQYEAAVQEQLTAYEAGFKQSLFGRTLQVNGAVFYYDYKDKQVRGRQLDPIAGSLVKLLNVPKSRALGAELGLNWRPVPELTLSANATYLDSKIKDYEFYNNFGVMEDFSGDPFPFSSELSATADVEYKAPVSETVSGFVGGSVTAQTKQRSALGEADYWHIPGHALFDVRAGLESDDGRWRLMGWVRNLTNEYYWNNALYSLDTFFRMTGKPRTYGLTLSYRFE